MDKMEITVDKIQSMLDVATDFPVQSQSNSLLHNTVNHDIYSAAEI